MIEYYNFDIIYIIYYHYIISFSKEKTPDDHDARPPRDSGVRSVCLVGVLLLTSYTVSACPIAIMWALKFVPAVHGA